MSKKLTATERRERRERADTARLSALLDVDLSTDPGAFLTAGWHGVAAPAVQAFEQTDPYGHTFHHVRLSEIPDTARLEDCYGAAERAAGPLWSEWSDDERAAAARSVSALRSHPAVVAARAAALSVDVDPADPDRTPNTASAVPDSFTARNHETVAKRTRKGNTVLERTRVGVASVVGSTARVAPGDLDGATAPDVCAAVVAMQREIDGAPLLVDGRTVHGVRRDRSGRGNAFDLQRLTDHYLRSHGVDPLTGSDVTSWHELREVPKGSDPRDVPNAVHRCGLTGWLSVPTVDAFAAHSAVHAAITRHNVHTADRPTRVTLPKGRKRANDPTDTRVFAVDPAGVAVSVWSLVSAGPDTEHRFVGHRLVKRPERSTRRSTKRRAATVRRTERNAQRTIGTVREPATVDAWRVLLADIGRGERLVIETSDGAVTVTRGNGRNARYSTSGARGRHRARTVESIALRIGQ